MSRQQQVIERVIVEDQKKRGETHYFLWILAAMMVSGVLIYFINKMTDAQYNKLVEMVKLAPILLIAMFASFIFGAVVGRNNERAKQALREQMTAYERQAQLDRLALPPYPPYNPGWGYGPPPPLQDYPTPLSHRTTAAPERRNTSTASSTDERGADPPPDWNDL